jgi:single-strand DNA-binding protein
MASFNKVILVGNLTADPELKKTPSGVSVTSFSIAVNRRFTKQGEQPQTDFINIVAWRQTAEFVARYFNKGRPILVCGQLQTRSWTDQNGQKRYTTEVVADEATFVENKGNNGGYSVPAPYGNEAPPSYSSAPDSGFEDLSADDELPF